MDGGGVWLAHRLLAVPQFLCVSAAYLPLPFQLLLMSTLAIGSLLPTLGNLDRVPDSKLWLFNARICVCLSNKLQFSMNKKKKTAFFKNEVIHYSRKVRVNVNSEKKNQNKLCLYKAWS